MKMSDVVELIRVDMPDYTEGAFDIRLESDDGGTHVVIAIEDHTRSYDILGTFGKRFNDQRIIVLKVPAGSLHS